MKRLEDVFSPRSFPESTYIEREFNNGTLENKFKRDLSMKGNLIFVTGPSKSGKTVLCNKVIDKEKIISLSGSQIDTKEAFWSQIAERLPLSDEIAITAGISKTSENASSDGLKIGFEPVIAAQSNISNKTGQISSQQVVSTKLRTERQMLQYLIDDNKVLVIDDFHYVAKEVQLYIARTLKVELFNGLKAVIVSLPHRSDEAIILNPDLSGRTTVIEIPAWRESELLQIAERGFRLLQQDIDDSQKHFLARESITSPQLMQDNCFKLAYKLIEDKIALSNELIKTVFRETARDYMHYKRIEDAILAGPSKGKGRRKLYKLINGDKDIYGVVVDALKADPPVTFINMEEMQARIKSLSATDVHISDLTVANAIKHIDNIVKAIMPDLDALEYQNKIWYILDPFLLFYLRWR